MRVILILLLCWAAPSFAKQSPRDSDANAVQSFIHDVSRTCVSQRAQQCIDAGWRFAARSPEQGLTLVELQELRQKLGGWFNTFQNSMTPQERGSVMMGLLLADGIGIQRLHSAFDTDGNGRVTQRELLADVKLDNRPLGAVLLDEDAVNRKALAGRLGMPPDMIEGLFTP
ncbi:MAG: hypothetical protein WD767_13210 [Alphaproteobacteria bacterium]